MAYKESKPKKKIKVKKLKEVKVSPVGRYTDKKQSMSKAKKKAKNFSKNDSTGFAAKVTPKKVKTITYKDGKKVKTTVAKDGKIVRVRGKLTRGTVKDGLKKLGLREAGTQIAKKGTKRTFTEIIEKEVKKKRRSKKAARKSTRQSKRKN
jgi:hypothetical protein